MLRLPKEAALVFIDSNIPMYLIGAEHPNKARAAGAIQRLAAQGERMVTDAEVFQEILHRYSAIRHTEAIQPAFDVLSKIADEVFAIDFSCVDRAKGVLLAYPALSSRDAIHVAAMQSHSVSAVVSFDSGFDAVAGIVRISA